MWQILLLSSDFLHFQHLPNVFCKLWAALKPTLAYREVQRISWPHWPIDAHCFRLQAIVVRHQISRRCWCFCQNHGSSVKFQGFFRERPPLTIKFDGEKTNLSFNELRAGAHLKSHGKIYQGFYIQLVSLMQIQLDGKSWTATAKRIIWKDTQHPPHSNLQHGYFVKFACLLEIWNSVVFRWRSFFFCVDICKKKR